MGEECFSIYYTSKKAKKFEDELLDIKSVILLMPEYEIGLKVLWQRGLRHLPTIVGTARKFKFVEKVEGMRNIFEDLRRKLKVRVRERCYKGDEFEVRRAFWPCEVLDLKEVQEEIKMLDGFSLSKDNPEDVEMVKRIYEELMMRLSPPIKEEVPVDRLIRYTEYVNMWIGELRMMLTKAAEFHRKHPDVKFWFYVFFV
jgi:hypothetical protein